MKIPQSEHIFELLERLSQLNGLSIEVNGQTIDHICLKEQFASSTHTVEEYTLYEHSVRVLGRAWSQREFFPDELFDYSIFEIILALHDIGKHLAHEHAGHKREQHSFTVPLVLEVFNCLDLSKHSAFASAILGGDPLGSLLKDQTSAENAYQKIQKSANACSWPLANFYRLLKFYYVADASSYDSLYQRIFEYNSKNALDLKSSLSSYLELKRLEELVFSELV